MVHFEPPLQRNFGTIKARLTLLYVSTHFFIYYLLIHTQISLDAVAGKLGYLILVLRILIQI